MLTYRDGGERRDVEENTIETPEAVYLAEDGTVVYGKDPRRLTLVSPAGGRLSVARAKELGIATPEGKAQKPGADKAVHGADDKGTAQGEEDDDGGTARRQRDRGQPGD